MFLPRQIRRKSDAKELEIVNYRNVGEFNTLGGFRTKDERLTLRSVEFKTVAG